jgi:alanine racemase
VISHRPIKATIHAAALRHNLSIVKTHASQSKVMAVIKANAYGHGLLRVAKALNAADGFAVLGINEALALREAGFQQVILLLEGLFDKAELAVAAQYNIATVVHCEQQLAMLEAADTRHEAFLKLNTGMNRLGFPETVFKGAYARLSACKSVSKMTLMTHFATADEAIGVTDQLALFNRLTAGLPELKTLANSAAILRHPQTHADWVRPGIMLYGATPVSGEPASSFGLQPAMTLSSAIIAVQELQPGMSVGYGQRFTAKRPTRVGVVACGYADGYPRHAGQYPAGENQRGTPVAVGGVMTSTIGRVSMDMLYVDLTELPQAGVGSVVELWGTQVPVDAVAEAAGTVGYELLCALAPRVPVVEN